MRLNQDKLKAAGGGVSLSWRALVSKKQKSQKQVMPLINQTFEPDRIALWTRNIFRLN